MYAILRINSFDQGRLAAARHDVEEFDRIHARQAGYAGRVSVDLGDGRRFALNLWDSLEHSQRALGALVPEVERLLSPLMSAPSQLVGVGPVVATDLSRARA